jgi:FkbM family methyltransferase
MASFPTKAFTVLRNPSVGFAYARWASSRSPTLKLPWGDELSGFRHFSEYQSTQYNVPTPAETAYVRNALRNGGIALDIGANIGSFSLLIAHCGATAIHAFEPHPDTHRILVDNAAAYPNIETHNCAMSDRQGSARFTNLAGSPCQNHLIYGDTEQTTIVVGTDTVDNFCERHAIERIAFAKIDVEGLEPWVLQGAKHMMAEKRIGALLIEVIPEALRNRGSSLDELQAVLRTVGYKMAPLSGSHLNWVVEPIRLPVSAVADDQILCRAAALGKVELDAFAPLDAGALRQALKHLVS